MKGSVKVIELLNEALTNELTAINQYFLHAEMLENWGYEGLSKIVKKSAIDEMKHAEVLMERILFLEGTPNMSRYLKITIGQTVPDQFNYDLKSELFAVELYNRAAAVCADEKDLNSRELFLTLLKDEEEHVDWLETQLELIKQMGLPYYLSQQMKESE